MNRPILSRDEILSGKCYYIPNCVLASRFLRPAAKVVYMAILDRLNDGDDDVLAPPAIIAKVTNLSVRRVKSAIRQLVDIGLISPVQHPRLRLVPIDAALEKKLCSKLIF